MEYFEAIKNRRTHYAIGSECPISDSEVEEIVRESVKLTPSAFNSQSSRVVLLLNDSHEKLWNITMETLRKRVAPEKFGATEKKINSFKNGHGTVLFFEDNETVEGLQKAFPSYEANFPVWSNQSSGMLQYVIWAGLSSKNVGASLQHYNPIIDEEVAIEFNISPKWRLVAQMPFGNILEAPQPPSYKDLENRVTVKA